MSDDLPSVSHRVVAESPDDELENTMFSGQFATVSSTVVPRATTPERGQPQASFRPGDSYGIEHKKRRRSYLRSGAATALYSKVNGEPSDADTSVNTTRAKGEPTSSTAAFSQVHVEGGTWTGSSTCE